MATMKLSIHWHDFEAKLDKHYLPLGKLLQLSMDFGEEPDTGKGP